MYVMYGITIVNSLERILLFCRYVLWGTVRDNLCLNCCKLKNLIFKRYFRCVSLGSWMWENLCVFQFWIFLSGVYLKGTGDFKRGIEWHICCFWISTRKTLQENALNIHHPLQWNTILWVHLCVYILKLFCNLKSCKVDDDDDEQEE